MSNINVSIEQVAEVVAHPNADRLEIIKILGTQTIAPKGEYKVGDRVVFFPPDILIPPAVSEKLGVQKYLKGCMMGGLKLPCRVAACRLRGVPSYGFIIRDELSDVILGTDVSAYYKAEKYEPPVSTMDRRRFQGDCAADNPAFHKYTDIQNYWKYAPALPEGTLVRITEKIHGTNSRIGYIRTEDGYVRMAGSHKTNRKEYDAASNHSLYWRPFQQIESIFPMLVALSNGVHDVVIFGELFGPGIQDMDYGIVPGEVGYQVFDITIDGQYIDWDDLQVACEKYGVPTVPLLYRGPFSKQVLDLYTDGPTTLGSVRSKFTGREGVVVTPLHETFNELLGRLILKNKSADYLDRRDAQDNE